MWWRRASLASEWIWMEWWLSFLLTFRSIYKQMESMIRRSIMYSDQTIWWALQRGFEKSKRGREIWHVFCYGLQDTIWYKASASEKTEERDINSKDSGEVVFMSASAALCPAFEIYSSVLYYIRTVENCSQTTAAKRTAHTSVVEMAIHFWQSWSS